MYKVRKSPLMHSDKPNQQETEGQRTRAASLPDLLAHSFFKQALVGFHACTWSSTARLSNTLLALYFTSWQQHAPH